MKIQHGWQSLGEYIVKAVRLKTTGSDEFKTLLTYYGKEKIRKLYDEEIEKEKTQVPCSSPVAF